MILAMLQKYMAGGHTKSQVCHRRVDRRNHKTQKLLPSALDIIAQIEGNQSSSLHHDACPPANFLSARTSPRIEVARLELLEIGVGSVDVESFPTV